MSNTIYINNSYKHLHVLHDWVISNYKYDNTQPHYDMLIFILVFILLLLLL